MPLRIQVRYQRKHSYSRINTKKSNRGDAPEAQALSNVAREMNIVPGLHLTLVSVPKLSDAGYTAVFSKK